MKTLKVNQMESVQGGRGIVDGACEVLKLSAAGAAGRFAMARLGMVVFFSIPVWGQVALAIGAVGCTIRSSMA